MSDGIGIRIETTGADEVLGALREIARSGADLRPALEDIADAWLARIDLEFRDSTDPYGRPWADLVVREGQPLRDTGRLAASFDRIVEPLSLVIGTNVEYAPTHQFGAEIRAQNAPYLVFKTPDGYARKKEVTIPPRPMLPAEGLPEAWAEDALDILRGYLEVGA